jgi:hypothetical protein
MNIASTSQNNIDGSGIQFEMETKTKKNFNR